MIQSADPTAMPVPAPDSAGLGAGLAELKGLSLGDLLSKLAQDSVDLVIHIAIAVVVFVVGRSIIKRLTDFTVSVMTRRSVDLSLSTFLVSMVKIVLYFILIITVIGILGINTSSFLALFASAGVAIGMALSGTLQNFAGGVLILLLKPYRVDDYIEAQGYSGTVREIQVFHTIITTPDNKSIIIPNGGLSTGTINNWSRGNTRRVSWDVAIAYGDSVDAAREKILAMLAEDSRVIHGEKHIIVNPLVEAGAMPAPDLSPSVVVAEMADSAVKLQVRAWTDTGNYWDLFYTFNERIYKELPEAGIHFPFPQMDVHINPQA